MITARRRRTRLGRRWWSASAEADRCARRLAMGTGSAVAAGLAAWACVQALRLHTGVRVRLRRILDDHACVGHASWLAVSVETDTLNHWPADVVNNWWRSSGGPLRTYADMLGKYAYGFYDMGVLAGIATMLVACIVVTVTALQVGSRLSSWASPGLPRMQKRTNVHDSPKAQPWLAPVVRALCLSSQLTHGLDSRSHRPTPRGPPTAVHGLCWPARSRGRPCPCRGSTPY